jgi:hypothetical protein
MDVSGNKHSNSCFKATKLGSATGPNSCQACGFGVKQESAKLFSSGQIIQNTKKKIKRLNGNLGNTLF